MSNPYTNKRAAAAFMRDYHDAAISRSLHDCEHGHLDCSIRDRGPCFDEVLTAFPESDDCESDVSRLVAMLESIVDGNGLAETFSALSIVCQEKGEHVREIWQDESLARQWERYGRALDRHAADAYNRLGFYKNK